MSKTKSLILKILSITLSLILLLYVGYHVINLFLVDVTTEVATKATANITSTEVAYIFKDEDLVYSSTLGDIVYSQQSGEKTGINDTVANIYTQNVSSIVEEINKYEEERNILLECINLGLVSKSNTDTIDAELINTIIEMNKSTSKNDLSITSNYATTIKQYLIKRSIANSPISSVEKRIYELNAKIETLRNQLGEAKETITSPSSGYFYNTYDGLENYFTIDTINTITFSEFIDITTKSVSTYNQHVVGKISYSYEWKIAFVSADKYYKELDIGDILNIKFPLNSNYEIDMTVDRIIRKNDNSEIVVVLKTNKVPTNFNFTRAQEIIVRKGNISGLKISENSLRIVDGTQGIYILNGTTVNFRRVSIIEKIDNYYIINIIDPDPENPVKYIKTNDIIITSGKNLYDGKIVS